jgi:hypothetical protein
LRLSDQYIADSLYPDEDYRGEPVQLGKPPTLWVDAQPIKEPTSNGELIFYGLAVPFINDTVAARAIELVPECGNKQRRIARIHCPDSQLYIMTEQRTVTSRTVGSPTRIYVAGAARVEPSALFVYTGSQALYAVARNLVASCFVCLEINRTELRK